MNRIKVMVTSGFMYDIVGELMYDPIQNTVTLNGREGAYMVFNFSHVEFYSVSEYDPDEDC